MSHSGDIELFDMADVFQGVWVRHTAQFQRLSIFKASNSQYFCDMGGQQCIAPECIQKSESAMVMTLVASDLTHQQLLTVLNKLKEDYFELLVVKTLSTNPVAVEIYFDYLGQSPVFDQSRWESWLSFADSIHADIGLKSVSHQGRRVRLACFDMDSTLIQAEVIDELAAEAGLMKEVSAITESAMRGELDFQQSFTQRLGMLKGLPESAVASVMARIPLMEGAEKLFHFLNQQGVYTAILSGGFDVFARHVQQKLNIKEVHANVLDFDNHILTGEAVLPIMDAARKQSSLIQLAEKLYVPLSQTLAVGDGANDLQMLDVAGIGVAFRAKPKVQASARIAIRHGDLSWVPFFLGFLQ